MRIGIIGMGTVGEAVAGIHDRTLLMYHDPKFEEWEHWTIEKIIKGCGWIYLCLPTPINETGECDTSILVNMFDQLKEFEGVVISRSTAPPRFYLNAIKDTGPFGKYKFRLVYMPVFINPETALKDLTNPELIVVGGNMKDVNYVAQFVINSDMSYKHKVRIVKTDIGSAAAIKYYADSFLAHKVMWNTQYADWCKSQGVNWANLTQGLAEDKRLGHTHYDLANDKGDVGYSEPHVLDNINLILKSAEVNNVDLSILEMSSKLNQKLKQAQDEQRELEAQTRLNTKRRREDRIERASERKSRRR